MSGLFKMFSAFSLTWKLGAIGAGLLSVVLTALLMASYFETRNLSHQRDQLNTLINDPRSGYVVRLAQAETNSAQLQAGIAQQMQQMQAEAQHSAQVLASTRQALDTANKRAEDLQHRAAALNGTPPQGNSLENQVTDIDNRVLNDLRSNPHE